MGYMGLNRKRQAAGLWLMAGVPVLATFLQAIFALGGYSSTNFPIIGTIAQLLKSLAVMDQAATVFEQNPEVIPILFILVTVAWIAEGVAVFWFQQRRYANRAAGFVTLFLVLFLLAYLPLLQTSVPVLQLAGFLTIAVLAAGLSWGAVYTYDWKPDLDEQTKQALGSARERVQSARRQFEAELEQQLDEATRERLRPVAPGPVEKSEAHLEAFREECDRVLDELESVANDVGESPEERVQKAEIVATDSKGLNPEERVESAVDTLEAQLPDAVRQEFEDIHIVSRYGRSYEIRNDTDSNVAQLPSIETEAQVGGDVHDLADQIVRAIGEYPVPAVARAVDDALEHLDSLDSTIQGHEEKFDERIEEAYNRIEIVKSEINSVGGRPGERLNELLIEGRYEADPPPGPSAASIKNEIKEAKDRLHSCDFATAHERAERAVETSGKLISIAEFFRAIDDTISEGGSSVPLPAAASDELADAMRNSYERNSQVTYEVADGRVHFSYPASESIGSAASDASGTEKSDKVNTTSGTEATNPVPSYRQQTDEQTTDPKAIIDEAVYIMNELERAADDSITAQSAEIQMENLPSHCTETGVIETILKFGCRQRGVKSFDAPNDAPPGYLTLTVEAEENPAAVAARIRDRFLNNYDNTQTE